MVLPKSMAMQRVCVAKVVPKPPDGEYTMRRIKRITIALPLRSKTWVSAAETSLRVFIEKFSAFHALLNGSGCALRELLRQAMPRNSQEKAELEVLDVDPDDTVDWIPLELVRKEIEEEVIREALSETDKKDCTELLRHAISACGTEETLVVFTIVGHQDVILTNLNTQPEPVSTQQGIGLLLAGNGNRAVVELTYLLPWRNVELQEAKLQLDIAIDESSENNPGTRFLESLNVQTNSYPTSLTTEIDGTTANLCLTWT